MAESLAGIPSRRRMVYLFRAFVSYEDKITKFAPANQVNFHGGIRIMYRRTSNGRHLRYWLSQWAAACMQSTSIIWVMALGASTETLKF